MAKKDLQHGGRHFGESYLALLDETKTDVAAAQPRARRTLNAELVGLYWRIGRRVLEPRAAEGWGAKVIEALATDLKAAFPNGRGFGCSSLHYMRRFAAVHPDPEIVELAVGQRPWGHICVLLDGAPDDAELQRWYAVEAMTHGWSRAVLMNMVRGKLHVRQGAAPSNFQTTLPPPDSDMVQQATRDPYLLDFLAIRTPVLERDLEDALIAELERFLLELGTGFAYCGRQYPVRVGDDEYAIDLLFFNWKLNCFVAVEIQIRGFDPDHAGRLGFYCASVDDRHCEAHHSRTVGILICANYRRAAQLFTERTRAHPGRAGRATPRSTSYTSPRGA